MLGGNDFFNFSIENQMEVNLVKLSLVPGCTSRLSIGVNTKRHLSASGHSDLDTFVT